MRCAEAGSFTADCGFSSRAGYLLLIVLYLERCAAKHLSLCAFSRFVIPSEAKDLFVQAAAGFARLGKASICCYSERSEESVALPRSPPSIRQKSGDTPHSLGPARRAQNRPESSLARVVLRISIRSFGIPKKSVNFASLLRARGIVIIYGRALRSRTREGR